MTFTTNALARRMQIDVSVDNTTWLPVNGVNDIAPVPKDTMFDTTVNDTDGFAESQKVLTSAELTIKMLLPVTAGAFDPGQQIIRGTIHQFGAAGMVYVRWYDRNGLPEAYTAQMTPEWSPSKTDTKSVEEVTVKFTSNGTVTAIANPFTNIGVPVIQTISPSAQPVGGIVNIVGAYLSVDGVAAPTVDFGATAAAVVDVLGTSMLAVAVPSGATGVVAVTVKTADGTSAAVNYTV